MAERIAVLGAGSWGLAVAALLDRNGADVRLWEFNRPDYEKLVELRCHPDKLKQLTLADSIDITNDIEYAVEDAAWLVLAVPSQYLRSALARLSGRDFAGVRLVNLAKGIETSTLMRMSEVVTEQLGVDLEAVSTLSGPSHAEEVAADLPTAVVAAGPSLKLIADVQRIFSDRTFRVYASDDLLGVELGGSLKNIIAIAAGITAGLGLGDNTMGALLTRGLAEITRLGVTMGAQPRTFAGLSGVGDLITTCSSKHSRNRYVGEKIGRGEKLADILAGMTMVAEGVETARSGHALARKYGVEMPITNEVYEVLFNNKPPAEAVGDLMGRTLKAEIWQ
ncbi:MAG: NAD(P)-dependent glycerol-3-phosphate dehydrogenase [Candidatus Zixiibacteriota bacterium]|nr:MAG: NAD(P)-dependent glycerol-3-phosphate dehydrogenase [candidate division Zixibacteria bacterium]